MEVWVKGIATGEDALLSLHHGVDGIVVSNHGGRQLNGALATLDALPEIVDAVGGKIPVHVDGGIRHGTDVFKALALGADFVRIIEHLRRIVLLTVHVRYGLEGLSSGDWPIKAKQELSCVSSCSPTRLSSAWLSQAPSVLRTSPRSILSR